MDISYKKSSQATIDAYYVPSSSAVDYISAVVDLWYQLPLNENLKVLLGYKYEITAWSYEDYTHTVVFDQDLFNVVYLNFTVSLSEC